MFPVPPTWTEEQLLAAHDALLVHLTDLRRHARTRAHGWRKHCIAALTPIVDAYAELRWEGVERPGAPRHGDPATTAAFALLQHDIDTLAALRSDEKLAKRIDRAYLLYFWFHHLLDDPVTLLHFQLIEEHLSGTERRHDAPPSLADLGITAEQIAQAASLNFWVASLRGLPPQHWELYAFSDVDLGLLSSVDHRDHTDRRVEWLDGTVEQNRRRFLALGFLDDATVPEREIALALLEQWDGTLGALRVTAAHLAAGQ